MMMPVLLFASLRDAAGADRIEVSVNLGDGRVSISDIVSACASQFPSLAAWLPHVRVALNHEYVVGDALASPADEIAFIPPVSGGCSVTGT